MKKKYKKLHNNIDEDYRYYLGMENIYTVLFGHKPEGYRKADYIWRSLMKEYNYKGAK